jgi:hypothetical protein
VNNATATESFTANVAEDNDKAMVILDLYANRFCSNALTTGNVVALMSPKQARRIAIRLLEAADHMDDQAKYIATQGDSK